MGYSVPNSVVDAEDMILAAFANSLRKSIIAAIDAGESLQEIPVSVSNGFAKQIMHLMEAEPSGPVQSTCNRLAFVVATRFVRDLSTRIIKDLDKQ